jgi:hypothetical protein
MTEVEEKNPLLNRIYPIGSFHKIENHMVQEGSRRGDFCSSDQGVVAKHTGTDTAKLLCVAKECGYFEEQKV